MGEGTQGQELLALEHLWACAVASRNTVALELMLAPEFSIRTGGLEMSRSEWLELLAELNTGSLVVKDVSVNSFGQIAVVTATLHWQAQAGPIQQPTLVLDGNYQVTDVWVCRSGRWQLVSRASNKVQGARSAPTTISAS